MKPLIIGQGPSKTTVGQPALSGQTGKRIADMLGISHADLLARVEPVNITTDWQGRAKSGKGDVANIKVLREGAQHVGIAGRHVLCLGSKVARAFGAKAQTPFFTQFTAKNDLGSTTTAWLFPHTSGISRFWNDAANREKAAAFLKEFFDTCAAS